MKNCPKKTIFICPFPQNFELYPEQRKIKEDETSFTILSSKTMSMAEKKVLLEKRSGTLLVDQDIRNASRKLLGENVSDEKQCQALLDENRSNGGFSHVKKDQEGNFVCACFATCEMLKLLYLYPQCLLMDITYKVNSYLFPLNLLPQKMLTTDQPFRVN